MSGIDTQNNIENTVTKGKGDNTPLPSLTAKEIITKVFTDYYGEDRIDVRSYIGRERQIIVLIHFPQITISNSYKKSHIIKDLYVKYVFLEDGSLLDGPLYARSTFSSAEFLSNYEHSHVSLNPRDHIMLNGTSTGIQNASIRFSGVCLGSGPINNTISNLRHMFDYEGVRIDFKSSIYKINLLTLCIETDRNVRWESVEGGPYRRFANIAFNQSSSSSNIPRTNTSLSSSGLLQIAHADSNRNLSFIRTYSLHKLIKYILTEIFKKDGVTFTSCLFKNDRYFMQPTFDMNLLEAIIIKTLTDIGDSILTNSLLGTLVSDDDASTPPTFVELSSTLNRFSVVPAGSFNSIMTYETSAVFKKKKIVCTIYPVNGNVSTSTTARPRLQLDQLRVRPNFLTYINAVAPHFYTSTNL